MAIRYVLPGSVLTIGLVMAVANPGGQGASGFGLFAGAAGVILLTSLFLRLGNSSAQDRADEEQARDYLS